MVLIDHDGVGELKEDFQGVKGSIVRVYMEDFMTNHKAELVAGPHINLIMGMNGTGKSSIVCAICIGLAGKPSILKRATNLKSFIRRGANSSITEIELFNPGGQNYTVRRQIVASETDCTTNWQLNGKKCKLDTIENLTSELNIQLNNLCQFLPQGRVQEFAEMNSIRLLEITEDAIGNETLSVSHKRLIQINGEKSLLAGRIEKVGNSLRTAVQLNMALETEVQTYRQREAIKKRIEVILQQMAWLKWKKADDEFQVVQSELREVAEKKKEEDDALDPLKKSIEQFERHLGKNREEMQKSRQTSFSKFQKAQTTYDADKERVSTAINEINAQFNEVEKREKDKEARQKRIARKLEHFQSEMNEFTASGEHNETVIQEELVGLEGQKTDVMKEIININRWNESDKAEKLNLSRKITSQESDLQRLDDLRVSRMRFLEQNHGDVVKAINYFMEPKNKERLRGAIHEPMILHLCINDLAYGKIVERHIGINDMTAFFCEAEEDVASVTRLMRELRLRISVIHFSPPTSKFVKAPNSYTEGYMKKFHFKKVLLDLLEGPDYYMAYILRNFHPEQILIGTNETDKMSEEIISKTNLKIFYTDQYAYRISVSVYSKQKCTTTSYIYGQTPRIFTSEINANEKIKLQENIVIMKAELQKLSDSIAGRQERLNRFENERSIIARKMAEAVGKLERKTMLERNIRAAESALQKCSGEMMDLTELKLKAKRDCYVQLKTRIGKLGQIESTVKSLVGSSFEFNIMKQQSTSVQESLLTTKNAYDTARTSAESYNDMIRDLSVRVKEAKDSAEKLKKDAQRKSSKVEPPREVILGKLVYDDLEKKFNSEKAQLIPLAQRDVSVIKEYEAKLKQIEALKKEKLEFEDGVTALNNECETVKQGWLGPLNDLIVRINTNFSRFFQSMKCRGAVLLDKGQDEDDYSKYGVKILVSFRSGEELSELCGWQQSGGERAITTAIYVLSLQELTSVPFRVIDEINQGMDSKNESRFFNMLCDMATGKDTPQYFLLTPKMLPPVGYTDNVLLHFIMNGPHVANMYEFMVFEQNKHLNGVVEETESEAMETDDSSDSSSEEETVDDDEEMEVEEEDDRVEEGESEDDSQSD